MLDQLDFGLLLFFLKPGGHRKGHHTHQKNQEKLLLDSVLDLKNQLKKGKLLEPVLDQKNWLKGGKFLQVTVVYPELAATSLSNNFVLPKSNMHWCINVHQESATESALTELQSAQAHQTALCQPCPCPLPSRSLESPHSPRGITGSL